MRCPFLEETTVRSCGEESGHPVFLRADEEVSGSPCLGSSWVECSTAREHFARERLTDLPARDHCPLLRERLVQYCSAAPARAYIPYIHGLLSRCQNESFRYCPLYLQRERPAIRLRGRSREVHGLTVATDRDYTRNHFWIDEGEFGLCHIGIDDFVAQVFDHVSIVHYVSRRGLSHPHVIIGNDRVQLDLLYPEEIEITETNAHLRLHPETVLQDPYGAGWLFEGHLARSRHRTQCERGLVPGEDAPAWIDEECRRLDSFVHEQLLAERTSAGPTAADGGRVRAGLTGELLPLEIARLIHEFFRPLPKG